MEAIKESNGKETKEESVKEELIEKVGFEFWNVNQVAAFFNISTKSVYRNRLKGKFPRPYKVTGGISRWRSDEILKFAEGLETA